MAGAGYFKSMQIPLTRGRMFDERDNTTVPAVMIINETFASRYFAGQDPIGKRIRPGGRNSTAPWFTIIGVVGDVRSRGLDLPPDPQMYRSILQTSDLASDLVVRTTVDPASLAALVDREIRAIDPDLPLYASGSMEELIGETLSQRRFSMLLLSAFGVMASLLSGIGIFGVAAFLVQQRTGEIGVRVALGAARRDIFKLVIGEGLNLAILGVVVGLAGAFAGTRLIAGLLYGISAIDAPTFAGVSILIVGVAGFGCYIPARRAMRIDPMVALRNEP
jgi:putative ABC transport system permease protein